MFHLLLWGNAYVEKIRNPLGSIIALRPINPARVKPRLFKPGEGDPNAKVYEVKGVGRSQTVEPYTNYEIMHVPGPGYDGLMGLSPIGVARQSVGISLAAEELAATLYGNGNLMSGVLSTDVKLDQGQADMLKARWREKVQGSRHAHDIAVLDAGTKFTPTSMPPEDAQFLQTRRWQTIEIARLYGIPPHLLGDVEKSTSWGTGIEQQNLAFVAYTLRPWLNRIEQRVTREIVEPSTQYAEFLVDGLLRGDSAQRAASYVSGIQWGYLTRNEVRVKENLQPLEGLDEPLTPLNMAKGDAQGPLVPQEAPPAPTDSAPSGADVSTTA
jgi:HK97 family phage portal protein